MIKPASVSDNITNIYDHLPSCTLTSLFVEHDQSPDAGIFALLPKDRQVAGRKGWKQHETEVSNEARHLGGLAAEK